MENQLVEYARLMNVYLAEYIFVDISLHRVYIKYSSSTIILRCDLKTSYLSKVY